MMRQLLPLVLLACNPGLESAPLEADLAMRVGVPTEIADLRSFSVALGTVVEVEGVVTAAGNGRIVLQQEQLAGITAVVGNRANNFAVGDLASVTGNFQSAAGYELVKARNNDPVVNLGFVGEPDPVHATWSQLSDSIAAEALESMLIVVPPARQAPAPFTRSFLPMSLLNPGDSSEEVVVYGFFHTPPADHGATALSTTGILAQYNTYRPLMPRSAADLVAGDLIGDIQREVDVQGNGGGADGDSVVVEGIAAADSGSRGFFLTNPEGGEYSGVYVYTGNTVAVSAGDRVRVTGSVTEYDSFGSWSAPLTEVLPIANGIDVLASNQPLPEADLIDSTVLTSLASAEPWEGVLVTLDDPAIIVSSGQSFGEYTATTSAGHTFVIDNELMDVSGVAGQVLSGLTGYVHTTYGEVKIAPRSSDDWIVGSVGSVPCDSQTAAVLSTLNSLDDVGDYIDMVWGDPSPCGYDTSRATLMFDFHWDAGFVTGVYTGRRKAVVPGIFPDFNDFNTEHTWPQSWGADVNPMRCDMHHLFPVDAEANSQRAAHQLDEIDGSVLWSSGGSRVGYNSFGNIVFEPRDSHKGNAARAILYYLAQYDANLFYNLEPLYVQWHLQDPVDDFERTRNAQILQRQGVSNPFITCPDLAQRVVP